MDIFDDYRKVFEEWQSQFGYTSYDEYQLKDKNFEHNTIGDWQYDLALCFCDTFELYGKTVIDIGCACGNMLYALNSVCKVNAIGYEPCKEFVERSIFKNDINLRNMEAKYVGLTCNENSIDFIYSIQVFEHFPSLSYSHEVLRGCFSVLKKNSFLYVNLVCGEHLTEEDLKKKYENGEDIDITHINIWPLDVWKKIGEDIGFKDVTDYLCVFIDIFVGTRGFSYFKEHKWDQFCFYKGEYFNKDYYLQKLDKKLERFSPGNEILKEIIEYRDYIDEVKNILIKYIK